MTRPSISVGKMSAEEAVRRILESQFPPASDKISRLMEKVLPLDPVELTPGVVLFHGHCDELETAVILSGTSRDGVALPGIKKKAHALFVLVSPEDKPAQHLHALTKVAYMAREFQRHGHIG